jgi:hypothetical protein
MKVDGGSGKVACHGIRPSGQVPIGVMTRWAQGMGVAVECTSLLGCGQSQASPKAVHASSGR